MRDLIKVLKSADQEIPEDLMELSHRAGRSKKKSKLIFIFLETRKEC